MMLLQYIPNFLPGVIAFVLPQRPQLKSFLWFPFILLLVSLYLLHASAALGWVLCLALGFAIPFFSEIRTGWLRYVSNRIATYSFGIYLSHQFCIWFVDDPLAPLASWIKVLVLTILLIGVPVALYHFIEKPMIIMGTKLAERWVRPPIVVSNQQPLVTQGSAD